MWKNFQDSFHKSLNEFVVSLASQPWMTVAHVIWVVEKFLAIRADIVFYLSGILRGRRGFYRARRLLLLLNRCIKPLHQQLLQFLNVADPQQ